MGNEGSRLKGLVIDKTAVEANNFFVIFNATKEPHLTNNKANNNRGKSNTTTIIPNVEEGRLEKLSIFQAERDVVLASLWGGQDPMKHAIKNYMIYRHPYLLKYIATWEQSGETFLATERISPLTGVEKLSDIQICLGLRNILCGLIFLTEKALARHLNICPASVYTTESGLWRLAGFEFVWKANELKNELIERLKLYRYMSAIDPDELKHDANRNTIEQYAFAVLCEEILVRKSKGKQVNDCDTPHIDEFREYCATVLRHKKPEMRPKLAAILLHPYFNHEFILIHSFLFELPLKSLSEKQAFFTGLVDRLRYFSESIVASQLTADLLSRMVLLDPTAQLCVTPYVLKTKNVENSAALFGRDIYLRHVMPHIRRMFRLRDAQIRLILLEYFMEYVRLLNEQELREFILPHLLLGINDTNDVLVAKTLRCMADLIPIIGASEVLASVSGNRFRLFSDGRPHTTNSITADNTTHWVEPRSITPVLSSVQDNRAVGAISLSDDDEVGFMVSGSPELRHNIEFGGSFNSLTQSELAVGAQTNNLLTEMPPRLSPDGGEDEKSVIISDSILSVVDDTNESTAESASCKCNTKLRQSSDSESSQLEKAKSNYVIDAEDDDAWSDWETEQTEKQTHNPQSEAVAIAASNTIRPMQAATVTASSARPSSKPIIDDLNSFDIQIQKIATPIKEKRDEFDFFKDMEPVIKPDTSTSIHARLKDQNLEEEKVLIDSSRFAAITTHENLLHDDGLGSGDNGWDVEEEYNVTEND